MSRNVKTVRPDSKLREIIQKMVKFNISCMIVMDQARAVGIITEMDILKSINQAFLDLDVTEAKNVMSGPLITVADDANIERASRMMLKNKIKKLPVVRDEKLIGIITSSDIVRGTGMLTGTLKDICKIGRVFKEE
jgi:CBS domain-containing protein